jgi:putative ABC transport system permease protein
VGELGYLGWDTADKVFEGLDPLDKIISFEGVHFVVVGIAAKKGAVFGNSLDEFAVIPLNAFQHVFGTRRSLSLTVRPRDVSLVQTAMDETTVALRIARRLKPKQPDNFGVSSADTFLELYNTTTRGIFAILMGVVSLSGVRRRDHEHRAAV